MDTLSNDAHDPNRHPCAVADRDAEIRHQLALADEAVRNALDLASEHTGLRSDLAALVEEALLAAMAQIERVTPALDEALDG